MRFDIPERDGFATTQRILVRWVVSLASCALLFTPLTAVAQDPVPAVPPAPLDTAIRPVGPVRPGDVLQLKLLGEEGMSGEYIIDPEGYVTIPGIGSVRLSNRTPREAQTVLGTLIRARIPNPEFSADFRIRVYVLGPGVASPGPYAVEPGTTFLQVLAIAGGQSDRANLQRTTVNREGRTYPVDLAAGLAGGHAGQYPVFSNDVIVVPARGGLTRENLTFALSLLGTALTVITLVVSLQRD